MNKLKIWIIGNDIPERLLKKYLTEISGKAFYHLSEHLELKITDITLREAKLNTGIYDIIILDLGAISEGTMTIGNPIESHFYDLRQFSERHSSSILRIISAVNNWAKLATNEIFKDLKEEITLEFGQNNTREIAKYILDQVLKYYPTKEN